MVNEEKVRIMTGIALDEKTNTEIAEGGCFKSDYIRFRVTAALWDITIGYLLILFLVGLYHADYLLVHIANLPYLLAGVILFGIYLLCIIICGVGFYVYYSREYIRHKKVLEEYHGKLERLQEFYQENKEETFNDTVTGIKGTDD